MTNDKKIPKKPTFLDTNCTPLSPGVMASYPQTRMRRNRQTDWSRRLIRESVLSCDDLIWPIFIKDGENESEDIASLPGVQRHTIDRAVQLAKEACSLGIPVIALFPMIPKYLRSADGSEAWKSDNLICRTTAAIKSAVPGIGILCDVALDPFTSHGHDGLIENGIILNDPTIDALIKQTLAQARAGCDIIAPSDMMDGRIGAIRRALDGEGFDGIQIMAYTAKYASAFYGPFREAVGSSKIFTGNKLTYQMDPANGDEALREAALDIAEGADMVMIKPGMPYLDIIWRIKQTFQMPTFAYQVSGEYAMLTVAAERGCFDGHKVKWESLISFKRAGANGILTYFALEIAKELNE
jgi:porphobilinogen synthase